MSILQKPDCFGRGCNRFRACCAQLLGDGRNGDVPAARERAAAALVALRTETAAALGLP